MVAAVPTGSCIRVFVDAGDAMSDFVAETFPKEVLLPFATIIRLPGLFEVLLGVWCVSCSLLNSSGNENVLAAIYLR